MGQPKSAVHQVRNALDQQVLVPLKSGFSQLKQLGSEIASYYDPRFLKFASHVFDLERQAQSAKAILPENKSVLKSLKEDIKQWSARLQSAFKAATGEHLKIRVIQADPCLGNLYKQNIPADIQAFLESGGNNNSKDPSKKAQLQKKGDRGKTQEQKESEPPRNFFLHKESIGDDQQFVSLVMTVRFSHTTVTGTEEHKTIIDWYIISFTVIIN